MDLRARIRGVCGEGGLALKYTAVSLVGFAVDAVSLKLGLAAGLEPAWARVISLTLAMHTTFLLNGLHVFGALKPGRTAVRQWATYMATNGFGNLVNYWVFVTLVSTHWRVVASPAFAMCAGSAAAWTINYACTRHLVFGPMARLLRRKAKAWFRPGFRPGPSRAPASPESSRP